MSDVVKKILKMAEEINEKYQDINSIEREMVNYYLSLSDKQKVDVSVSMIDIILIGIAQSIGIEKMHVQTAAEIINSIGEDSGACKIIEHLSAFYESICYDRKCEKYNIFMDEMNILYRKHNESMIHKITANSSNINTSERKKTNQDIIREAINDLE